MIESYAISYEQKQRDISDREITGKYDQARYLLDKLLALMGRSLPEWLSLGGYARAIRDAEGLQCKHIKPDEVIDLITTVDTPADRDVSQQDMTQLVLASLSQHTCLVINNPQTFAVNYHVLRECPYIVRSPWAEAQKHTDPWLNATARDLVHPEQFMDEHLFQLERPLFRYESEWAPIGGIEGLEGQLFVRTRSLDVNVEGDIDMEFALTAPGAKVVNPIDQLPSVRIRRTGPSEVIIGAVQMPYIGEITENVLDQNAERMNKLRAQYQYLADSDPQRFRYWAMGDIPAVLTDPRSGELSDAEFLERIYNDLARNYQTELLPFRATDKVFAHFSPTAKKRNATWAGGEGHLRADFFYCNEELDELTSRQKRHFAQALGLERDALPLSDLLAELHEQFEQRAERMKSLQTQGFIGGGRTPPTKRLVTALALNILQQADISNIRVPVAFPLRTHPSGDPNILRTITTLQTDQGPVYELTPFNRNSDSGVTRELDVQIAVNLLEIFKELAAQMQGLKFNQAASTPVGGYLAFTMDGPLTASTKKAKTRYLDALAGAVTQDTVAPLIAS